MISVYGYNFELDCPVTVFEQACLYVMDGKSRTGEELERPPHGRATPKAIKNFYMQMDYLFLGILNSSDFKDIKLQEHACCILGQGLVNEVDNFNKWLTEKGYTNLTATAAMSTFASESAGLTLTPECSVM